MIVDPAEALFSRVVLGSEAKEVFARRIGMGTVTGVELADGRRVRLKWWDGARSETRLRECRRVHHHLHASGFPSPSPIGELVSSEREGKAGWMAAEEWEERGEVADARQAPVRREMARGLSRLVHLAMPLIESTRLGAAWFTALPVGQPFPRMKYNQESFAETAGGAEWIDEIALLARSWAPRAQGKTVIGHFDFRSEHLLFDETGELSMVYDWDSLHLERETVMVGAAAHAFTQIDRQVPGLEEVLAFIDDYEEVRGGRFTDEERRTVLASAVYSTAYSARWSHYHSAIAREESTQPLGGDFRPLLRQLTALLVG